MYIHTHIYICIFIYRNIRLGKMLNMCIERDMEKIYGRVSEGPNTISEAAFLYKKY